MSKKPLDNPVVPKPLDNKDMPQQEKMASDSSRECLKENGVPKSQEVPETSPKSKKISTYCGPAPIADCDGIDPMPDFDWDMPDFDWEPDLDWDCIDPMPDFDWDCDPIEDSEDEWNALVDSVYSDNPDELLVRLLNFNDPAIILRKIHNIMEWEKENSDMPKPFPTLGETYSPNVGKLENLTYLMTVMAMKPRTYGGNRGDSGYGGDDPNCSDAPDEPEFPWKKPDGIPYLDLDPNEDKGESDEYDNVMETVGSPKDGGAASRDFEEYLSLFKKSQIRYVECGPIDSVADGIARVYGLYGVQSGELLEFVTESGEILRGMALNLEKKFVGAVLFGNEAALKEGDICRRTQSIISVPTGLYLRGRVVDPLGEPLDNKGALIGTMPELIERKAPGIKLRARIDSPLATGIRALDSLVPIGNGQRELIIGDRQVGKTALAVDTIIHQTKLRQLEADYITQEAPNCLGGERSGSSAVYVAIGQKRSSVAQLVRKLEEARAMNWTTVVAATASDPAPLQFLSAYAGCTIAEYFRDIGEPTLIVFDDLSKQAVAYRQVSLLLRRPPGREAFPGDVGRPLVVFMDAGGKSSPRSHRL
jgi:flagellar biosynthesis/type III secretory pathway ATPase